MSLAIRSHHRRYAMVALFLAGRLALRYYAEMTKKPMSKRKSGKKASHQNARVTMTHSGQRAVFVKGVIGSDPILRDGRSQIAFVGRSNVGKSSTINALLGARFARVSTTPGKTQEINFFLVNGRVYFVDLPGYGFARITARGAEKIRKHILWYLASGEARPSMVVLITDAAVGVTEYDRELVTLARKEGYTLMILANKIDKLNQSERVKALRGLDEEFPDITIVPFSAKMKENVGMVREELFLAAKTSKQ